MQAVNQLHALIDTAPDDVRNKLRHLPAARRIEVAARPRPGQLTDQAAAARWPRWPNGSSTCTPRSPELDTQLTALAGAAAAGRHGVGVETAGALLAAAGYPGAAGPRALPSPTCAAPAPWRCPRANGNATGSTPAETGKRTSPVADRHRTDGHPPGHQGLRRPPSDRGPYQEAYAKPLRRPGRSDK